MLYIKKLIITQTKSICVLDSEQCFDGCYYLYGRVNATFNPNGEQGYIYVPDELVDAYKTATNWSVFANAIKGLSELPQADKERYGL